MRERERERERERARERRRNILVSPTITGELRAPIRADLASFSPTTALWSRSEIAITALTARSRSEIAITARSDPRSRSRRIAISPSSRDRDLGLELELAIPDWIFSSRARALSLSLSLSLSFSGNALKEKYKCKSVSVVKGFFFGSTDFNFRKIEFSGPTKQPHFRKSISGSDFHPKQTQPKVSIWRGRRHYESKFWVVICLYLHQSIRNFRSDYPSK